MTLLSKLATSTHELERDLRAAAFEMIDASADYQAGRALLQIAEEVGLLGQRLVSLERPAPPEGVPDSTVGARKRSASSLRSDSLYPHFFVEGDRLVKIGKGKQRSAKPYRHEAERRVFDKVVAWIDQQIDGGVQPFKAADANEALSSDWPSYQIYLIISALNHVGALTSPSRGHYIAPGALIASSSQWWASLQQLPQPKGEV